MQTYVQCLQAQAQETRWHGKFSDSTTAIPIPSCLRMTQNLPRSEAEPSESQHGSHGLAASGETRNCVGVLDRIPKRHRQGFWNNLEALFVGISISIASGKKKLELGLLRRPGWNRRSIP